MAGFTGVGKSCGSMIWISSGVIIGLMTAHALLGGPRVSLSVATRAGNGCVPACEWKRGKIVIERGRNPSVNCVACFAILRKVAGHMVGVQSGFIVRAVARVAILR
ncbi:MAG: hypothetical protein EDM75_04975 [Chlorobiota bacterium]|nr:MAG: hypothetical protein EDM75_04975 [Chlorobiota bacterium]